jgi:hypothetical protein
MIPDEPNRRRAVATGKSLGGKGGQPPVRMGIKRKAAESTSPLNLRRVLKQPHQKISREE